MKILRMVTIVAITLGFMGFGVNAIAKTSTSKQKTTATAQQTNVVDLNTADMQALESLKGIGSKKAQAIIDYRTKNGAFASIDDLGKIKGFSDKLIARLQKNNPGKIVVNPSK